MKRPVIAAAICVLSFIAGALWAQQPSQPTRREPQFEPIIGMSMVAR